MKTTFLTMAMSLSLLFSLGQENKYHQKMGETLREMSTNKSVDDFQKTANTFQLISENKKTEWLPYYYNSFSYILMSFLETNKEKKDEYLDIAEVSIAKSIEIAPKEAENYALKAFLYTARLVVNPMQRGQKYSMLSSIEIQKALKLDSNNLRAKYLSLNGRIGKAKFFGENPNQFCGEANELLANWDNFQLKSPLHPRWGKRELNKIISDCSAKKEENSIESKKGNTLTIKFENLKEGGSIRLELLNEKKESVKKVGQVIEKNTCTIKISGLEDGTYAVKYYHDENNNERIDLGKFGIPKEGYGYSNDARGKMSAPKFKDQLFELNEDLEMTLSTKY